MATDFAMALALNCAPNGIRIQIRDACITDFVFGDIVLGSAIRNCEADSEKSAQLIML